jgi:predicted nucleotidyltransferase
MLFQIDALQRVDAFLKEYGIPYAVIGGIANAVRGEPRATHDADLKVLVQGMTIAEFRALAEARFKPYRRPWLGRAESTLIISLEVAPDMVVDMLVAVLPYEEQAIGRAEMIEVEGLSLPICTAEDLIIHKAIADRPKDWLDIEKILLRQSARLDVEYVRSWLTQFADALEKPALSAQFNRLLDGDRHSRGLTSTP